MGKTFIRVAAATALFAAVHSFFALRAVKQAAARVLGERRRNAFYRPFYNAQTIVTLGALVWYGSRLPDRVLYDLRGSRRAWLQVGRLVALGYLGAGAYQVGIARLAGWTGLAAWLRGQARVPPEPEAQGPALGPDGRMQATGPFKYSRHPLNFVILPVVWLTSKLTVRLLAFNLVATLYAVIGSFHEEMLLRAAYGRAYREYQRRTPAFLLPRPRRRELAAPR